MNNFIEIRFSDLQNRKDVLDSVNSIIERTAPRFAHPFPSPNDTLLDKTEKIFLYAALYFVRKHMPEEEWNNENVTHMLVSMAKNKGKKHKQADAIFDLLPDDDYGKQLYKSARALEDAKLYDYAAQRAVLRFLDAIGECESSMKEGCNA